ncbi:LysR family transcriptional regulator [Kordiimonas pumila]|uniref:LysR family transcriptional regulator n=1 Tax=Kordiimonas pumila TaxID=2161677 RepID=A0ABV7D0I1_9PROT|nr:LysR family transcriptional regulator [Kordiimonas pumila]
MPQWDGVEEFVAVAEAGSFTGAAKALGVSNAHISRAVAKLETKTQTRLFNRTTRSLALTYRGEVLLEPFRQLIEDRDTALAMIAADSAPRGELRITCSPAIAHHFLMPIARQYVQDFKDLSIWIDISNKMVDLIGEGFDLAIRTGHLPDSRLIATKLGSRRLCTCASKNYFKINGYPSSINDLRNHNCLLGTNPVWHFQTSGEKVNFQPKGNWRCNSGDGVVEAVLGDMGICQLPEHYIKKHLDSGEVELVLDDNRINDEPIWAVYPHRKHLLPKIKKLIDLLKTAMETPL